MSVSTGASEWCVNSVLGWLSIEGALPWWSTAIRMRGKMGWITKRVRGGCHRIKVVSVCVQSLVCWKAVEGTVALISRQNPRILSIQSLEAHQCYYECTDLDNKDLLPFPVADAATICPLLTYRVEFWGYCHYWQTWPNLPVKPVTIRTIRTQDLIVGGALAVLVSDDQKGESMFDLTEEERWQHKVKAVKELNSQWRRMLLEATSLSWNSAKPLSATSSKCARPVSFVEEMSIASKRPKLECDSTRSSCPIVLPLVYSTAAKKLVRCEIFPMLSHVCRFFWWTLTAVKLFFRRKTIGQPLKAGTSVLLRTKMTHQDGTTPIEWGTQWYVFWTGTRSGRDPGHLCCYEILNFLCMMLLFGYRGAGVWVPWPELGTLMLPGRFKVCLPHCHCSMYPFCSLDHQKRMDPEKRDDINIVMSFRELFRKGQAENGRSLNALNLPRAGQGVETIPYLSWVSFTICHRQF